MQGKILINGKEIKGRTLSFDENGFTVEDENGVSYKEENMNNENIEEDTMNINDVKDESVKGKNNSVFESKIFVSILCASIFVGCTSVFYMLHRFKKETAK